MTVGLRSFWHTSQGFRESSGILFLSKGFSAGAAVRTKWKKADDAESCLILAINARPQVHEQLVPVHFITMYFQYTFPFRCNNYLEKLVATMVFSSILYFVFHIKK